MKRGAGEVRTAGEIAPCQPPSSSLIMIGMTTVSVGGSLGTGWLSKRGFAKLAGRWLAGLLALYAIYALIAFFRLEPRFFSGLDRAVMVLGPSAMAVALLVSTATFAGSVMRFDLLTASDSRRQRVYWAQMATFGLGAYLLVAFGAPAIRSMVPGASDLPPETFAPHPGVLSGLRLLFPVPFGLFAIVSGVAGGLIGRITSRSVLTHAAAVPWLACLGLVSVFSVGFLGAASMIVQYGFSPVWIIVAPVIVPVIVISVLAWRYSIGPRALLPIGGERTDPDPLGPDRVDEILSKLIESQSLGEDAGDAASGGEEGDVSRVVRGIRRDAGFRARMCEPRVTRIVEHLVRQGDRRRQRPAQRHTRPLAAISEFCSACMSLAGGCLVVGMMGGLMPSVYSAAIAATIGSAAVLLSFRDRAALTKTDWPAASRQ